MANVVQLRDAVSLAGRFPLLSGATLVAEEGEVVHLRGPNGAGKTSLLRACAGLIAISSGEAVVLGHDLRVDRRALRNEVGLLGHSTFLYDDLTVEDNLRFALRASRADEHRAGPALRRLGLEGRLASTAVRRLSAGQRRRGALAVLYARNPRLWLLDEPHAGLDAEGQDVVDALVTEARATGATVLIASHELDRTLRVADRVIEVVGGRVVAEQRATSQPEGVVAIHVPEPSGTTDRSGSDVA